MGMYDGVGRMVADSCFFKTECQEHAASQLTSANRAKLRVITFSRKVKRLMPANLERWELQAENKITLPLGNPPTATIRVKIIGK